MATYLEHLQQITGSLAQSLKVSAIIYTGIFCVSYNYIIDKVQVETIELIIGDWLNSTKCMFPGYARPKL